MKLFGINKKHRQKAEWIGCPIISADNCLIRNNSGNTISGIVEWVGRYLFFDHNVRESYKSRNGGERPFSVKNSYISYNVYEVPKSIVMEILRTGILKYWLLHSKSWESGGFWTITIHNNIIESCFFNECYKDSNGDLIIPHGNQPANYSLNSDWNKFLSDEKGYPSECNIDKYRDIILNEILC